MLLFFAFASLVSGQDDIPVNLAPFQGKCHTFVLILESTDAFFHPANAERRFIMRMVHRGSQQ